MSQGGAKQYTGFISLERGISHQNLIYCEKATVTIKPVMKNWFANKKTVQVFIFRNQPILKEEKVEVPFLTEKINLNPNNLTSNILE